MLRLADDNSPMGIHMDVYQPADHGPAQIVLAIAQAVSALG